MCLLCAFSMSKYFHVQFCSFNWNHLHTSTFLRSHWKSRYLLAGQHKEIIVKEYKVHISDLWGCLDMPNDATGKASGTRDKVLYPSRPGVPNLRDLMPNDLRWSWCNSSRNKMHNKHNMLGSSWNHPARTHPPKVHGKIVFLKTGPWCWKGWGPLLCTAYHLGISLNKKFAEPVACHLFRIWNRDEERKQFKLNSFPRLVNCSSIPWTVEKQSPCAGVFEMKI